MTRIFLASDSTCQRYENDNAPQAGWGQFIQNFMKDCKIFNHAIGGRSSKSFIEEGRLKEIEILLEEGDYLLVQMGHNDSTKEKPERYTEPYNDYKQFLKQYVMTAREKQANPILVTPVARLHYVSGEFLADFGDYCNAMKEVGEEENCPVIDFMTLSIIHLTNVGIKEATTYYMVDVNGKDHTHFTETGAKQMAKLLAEPLKRIVK
ncbi:Lysophospholipase L1 [Gracilibacillus ureilyticus]|uniref:Lysophospholipase L1 n=1 Tax=Gracilibacillus ureilyticus TaxID=531814 RepID=A0A1H9P4P0_9BACI|nr:rhamnogalacturonan acetylesterase [Gracilibacillus ureilyticus]SER42855.1 Lysophospholipase L1 [Gracilibacillus ureilyticus]